MAERRVKIFRDLPSGALVIDLPVRSDVGFLPNSPLTFRVDTGAHWTTIPRELAESFRIPCPPPDQAKKRPKDAQGNSARGSHGKIEIEILGKIEQINCYFLDKPSGSQGDVIAESRASNKSYGRDALLGRADILSLYSLRVEPTYFVLSRVNGDQTLVGILRSLWNRFFGGE